MNKKWGKTSLSSGLVLAMLIPGVACQSGDVVEQPSVGNEFGVLLEGLGDDITECTNAGAALASGTLTLDLADGEDAVVSVVSSKLKVNGHQCMTASSGGTEITTSTATKLVINGASGGTNKIVFDLLPGDFGGLFGTSGGITVNVPGAANTAVSVGVRGTDATNNFKMAQADSGTDLFLELNNNTQADVKIVGDPSSVVFTLGGGADVFNATDTTSLTFQGSAQTLRSVQSENLTVYGGAGADVLEGGLGDDTLNGGADADTFNMLTAGGDGADTYIGGSGTDTVDYSNRDAGVTVDIDPEIANAYVEGSSVYGLVMTGATLDITIGATQVNYTAGASQGITAFLADLNADLGVLGTASVDDHGQLRIVAALNADDIVVATNTLGIPEGTVSAGRADNDDGETGADEGDDVQADVENIKGSAFADVLTGSVLANVIDGNAGDDSISGGPAGTCTGNGADVDTLNGGADNDTFPMGTATNCGDVVDGGAGIDIANYERRSNALTITIDGSANDGEGSGGSSEADNIKTTLEVLVGGTAGDTLTGGTGNDEIHGGAGGDTIKGGAGNDTLTGNAGIDTLSGEAGDDFIDEATAEDARFEDVGASNPNAFAGADVIHGGTGTNTCDFRRGDAPGTTTTYTLCSSTTTSGCNGSGADGVDGDDVTNCSHIKLDGGADDVTGSSGDDIVEGGDGADILRGGDGNDSLYGEGGDDTLTGEAGNDTVDGGAAQTVDLDGGDGDDICVSPGSGDALNCEF